MRKLGRRSRGGRAPQVNDGTFEGILAPFADGSRPTPAFFNAVAYSPGNGGGAELWALRMLGNVPSEVRAVNWNPDLAPTDRKDPTTHKALFLDEIDENAFNPSTQFPIHSPATAHAIREYAHMRFLAQNPTLGSRPEDWDVVVIRPGGFPTSGDGQRWQHRHMYSVHQHDPRSQEAGMLVAWFWIPHDQTGTGDPLGRELWRYYRRGELEGYRELGDIPAGSSQRYTSTILRFQEDPVQEGMVHDTNLVLYQNAIDHCLLLSRLQTGSPQPDVQNSELVDYRSERLLQATPP